MARRQIAHNSIWLQLGKDNITGKLIKLPNERPCSNTYIVINTTRIPIYDASTELCYIHLLLHYAVGNGKALFYFILLVLQNMCCIMLYLYV